jgi:hypothetical protein
LCNFLKSDIVSFEYKVFVSFGWLLNGTTIFKEKETKILSTLNDAKLFQSVEQPFLRIEGKNSL